MQLWSENAELCDVKVSEKENPVFLHTENRLLQTENYLAIKSNGLLYSYKKKKKKGFLFLFDTLRGKNPFIPGP